MTDQAFSRRIATPSTPLSRREFLTRITQLGLFAGATALLNACTPPPTPDAAPAGTIIDEPQPRVAPTATAQSPVNQVDVTSPAPIATAAPRADLQAEIVGNNASILVPVSANINKLRVKQINAVPLKAGSKLPYMRDPDNNVYRYEDWALVMYKDKPALVYAEDLSSSSMPNITTQFSQEMCNKLLNYDFSRLGSNPSSFLENLPKSHSGQKISGVLFSPVDQQDLLLDGSLYNGSFIDKNGDFVLKFIVRNVDDGVFTIDTSEESLQSNQLLSNIKKSTNVIIRPTEGRAMRVGAFFLESQKPGYVQGNIANSRSAKFLLDYASGLILGSINQTLPWYASFSTYSKTKNDAFSFYFYA